MLMFYCFIGGDAPWHVRTIIFLLVGTHHGTSVLF